MLPFNPFISPEHEDFTLPGGAPAALLVHGFPASPLEMRPLADALNGAGWTCRGLLLPGFGPDLESLPDRQAQDWLSAVTVALADLREGHAPLLLVGHSMGGAISLAAAASQPLDGLVLLAPFWKVPSPLWGMVPLMKALFPTVQPFRLQKVDFDAPRVRRGLEKFLPGFDLDDLHVQAAIRAFAVPVGIFDALRQAGLMGFQASAHVDCPTLVIQGLQDETVLPAFTRQVVKRLRCLWASIEVHAGHDLPLAEGPAFQQVRQALLSFGETIAALDGAPL